MRISEGTSQAHAVAVLNDQVDAVFIVGEPRLPGCDTRRLCEEALFAAVPANHALALRARLAWEDLRDETMLVMADGSGPELEGLIVRRLSTLGFRPKIAVIWEVQAWNRLRHALPEDGERARQSPLFPALDDGPKTDAPTPPI